MESGEAFQSLHVTRLLIWMANERINHKARELGDYIVLPSHLWKFLLIVEFLNFFQANNYRPVSHQCHSLNLFLYDDSPDQLKCSHPRKATYVTMKMLEMKAIKLMQEMSESCIASQPPEAISF